VRVHVRRRKLNHFRPQKRRRHTFLDIGYGTGTPVVNTFYTHTNAVSASLAADRSGIGMNGTKSFVGTGMKRLSGFIYDSSVGNGDDRQRLLIVDSSANPC